MLHVRRAKVGVGGWPPGRELLLHSRRWLLALAAMVLALALSEVSANSGATLAPLYFLAAVALSGWYGGLAPALLATALGFLLLDYYFERPAYLWDVTEVGTPAALAGFLVVAVSVGSLNARLRVAHDRALDARLAAERALSARNEALVMVSHDLRTPLTTIKTAVSTLRNPEAHVSRETREDLLRSIEAEADRLSRFVRDALALSRLEAGIAANAEWNSADEVIGASLEHVFGSLSSRPISVDVPTTLPLARFDASLLDQALSNLLDNADVHTPSGTHVAISASAEGTTLRIDVSDAGPGVPPPARQRIFEKFERVGSTGRGAGLGLAIARAAIEAQSGCLTVDDSPLGGARFVVRLPHAIPETATPRGR
jgi:K+-sensing histidine kinase KdpD